MNIINSKEKASNLKSWSDPGSRLYDTIKDSKAALHEAYLVVGDKAGEVPYSRSGCKYPHHVLNRDGDLIVSIAGVKAAYSRAKQMGIFKGDIKKHLMRHYKELGIYKGSTMEADEKITENFNRIEEFLGIDESKYMTESYDEDSSMEELASWIDDVAHNGFTAFTENTFREISFEFEEKGIDSPQKLLEWMDCIEYDKSISDWHLRSVGETYFDKKGNCHDQSLFELIALGEMEYPCGQLFFLEVNEGQTVGGNSHTLTWYMDNNEYYWFEHSWENKRGIHGPYQSLDELKKDVYHEWETDDDINQKEFERIEFWNKANYKIGMTLGEYVESWTDNESYDESDDETDLDGNFVKKDISAIEYEVIDYNDNHDLCEDYFRRYNIFTSEEATVYNREKKNGEIIIDKSNNSLIGLVLVFESDGTLTPLKVMPEYRGYGFSNILMRDAVDKYGAKYLGVYADNEVAVELYKKFGFEVYKTKEDEDGTLLFMRRADLFDESTNDIEFFTEKNLHKEFRYVIDETNGHFIKIVYEMNPDNIVGFGGNALPNEEDKKNMRKVGHTNYVSKGNKIVAIVDMCNNKRLQSVSGYPPIHNIGGKISPVTIKGYMGIMKRFIDDPEKLKQIEDKLRAECPTGIAPDPGFEHAIKNSKKKGQNPIMYRVGEIDNTATFKTTNPKHTIRSMFPGALNESTDLMSMFMEADENDPPELSDDETTNNDTPQEETPTEPPSIEDTDIMSEPVEQKEEPAQEEPTPEEAANEPVPEETAQEEEKPAEPQKPVSMPKQTDAAEKDKNGVRRKKLYIAFIEWCKEYNSKNTFGSIFDKDIFHNVYPFVPHEMRYFYRLANPILCVLGGELTFFQVSELNKLNKDNKDFPKLLIFAATPNDLRVFNTGDKKVYLATDEGGKVTLGQSLGDTFDVYIQNMIKQGDILNGPIESETPQPETAEPEE